VPLSGLIARNLEAVVARRLAEESVVVLPGRPARPARRPRQSLLGPLADGQREARLPTPPGQSTRRPSQHVGGSGGRPETSGAGCGRSGSTNDACGFGSAPAVASCHERGHPGDAGALAASASTAAISRSRPTKLLSAAGKRPGQGSTTAASSSEGAMPGSCRDSRSPRCATTAVRLRRCSRTYRLRRGPVGWRQGRRRGGNVRPSPRKVALPWYRVWLHFRHRRLSFPTIQAALRTDRARASETGDCEPAARPSWPCWGRRPRPAAQITEVARRRTARRRRRSGASRPRR
jgi:hypothetical protein